MKKLGKLAITMVVICALVGVCYKGPIKDLAKSFMVEIEYFFNINPNTALEKPLQTDGDSLTANVIGDITINDDVEKPDWDMESSAGEIFGELSDRFPLIQEFKGWVDENIFKKSSDSEENIE